MATAINSFSEHIEDYEVHNLLGKGGFASVYRAKCLKTGAEVAIKMIDKKLMQAAGMVSRVRQEVSIHYRLKHPSILELYTFFEDQNYVYLVLELCHNGELQQYLRKHTEYASDVTTSTTQDSGIHTMSSKRDNSALNDGTQSSNQCSDHFFNRKCNSDCTPAALQYQRSAHSSRSVDRLANRLQQAPLLHMEASEPISVFSHHGSNSGLYTGKIFQEEVPLVHSHCSQNCCQPTDPGGGIILQRGNECRAGSQCLQSQCCAVQTSHCSHGNCVRNDTDGRYINDNISSHKTENIRQSSNNLQQLCALRLLPTRHQTKNAILSILEGGEVCVEFIKKKGQFKREMVCEVCRISPDGERIILYEPEGGKGVLPGPSPPDLPPQGTDQIFSFGNLPEKHWKKYMYAFKFIELVRAKTPKITYYSDKAKCMLMENLVDFEACFYDGGKVTQSKSEGITIIDTSGSRLNFKDESGCLELPGSLNLLWNYSQEFRNQCLLLERTIAALPGPQNFPIIVGRRPQSFTLSTPDKENRSRNPLPSFSASASSCNTPIALNSASTKERKINVPGVGTAIQLPTGEVRVRFTDGSQLWVDGKHHVQYQYTNGKMISYSDTDNIPRPIMEKLQLMPKVLKHLMPNPVLSKVRCLR
ncbi:serine/threonine-protein kinase plk [Holotrichia oblita]|uniref:Serine/threonine-protein kinase plk n=1 Tax=Holotrichia oblita TaxID=644536 RepID=A0ACB9SX81_HOLOL|nr:serine/threonine-protein kinase plk [Holotrichia oblita]